MLDVLGFWLDRGVDGCRLDAVNALFEDVELRNNPPLAEPILTLTGIDTQESLYTRGLPELHDTLRRVRRFVDRRRPDALLISEAYVGSADELTAFYGGGDEMHLPFNFFLTQVPNRSRLRPVRSRCRSRCGGAAAGHAAADAARHAVHLLRRGARDADRPARVDRGGARSGRRTMRQAATWKSRPPIRIRFSTSIVRCCRSAVRARP
jgi:glycosidase